MQNQIRLHPDGNDDDFYFSDADGSFRAWAKLRAR